VKPRFCAICGRLAPTCRDEHLPGDWLRVDLDGRDGEMDPLWICPAHRDETDADLAVQIHCALMRAAMDRFSAVAA